MRLDSAALLRRAVCSGRVLLPFERGAGGNRRLVGQSLLISPAKHPFWLGLIKHLVTRYDRRCYAPSNTGPDAVTMYVNRHVCMQDVEHARAGGVAERLSIEEGFMGGPITHHFGTGSWRKVGVSSGMATRGNTFGICPRPGFAELNSSCDAFRH